MYYNFAALLQTLGQIPEIIIFVILITLFCPNKELVPKAVAESGMSGASGPLISKCVWWEPLAVVTSCSPDTEVGG